MTETAAKVSFLKALNKVQGTIEPVTKDSTNPHFKSKYASLAAVNAVVMGPLTENGFVLLSGGVAIAGKPYLRTSLHHIEGHSESFDYPLIENAANPQHVASSVTYARRYSICALLNLSVEDDDGNAASAPAAKAAPALEAARKVFGEKAEKKTPGTGFVEASFVPMKYGEKTFGEGEGAWVQYSVFDGSAYYSTKKADIGAVLKAAHDQDKPVKFLYAINGKYRNIVGLVKDEQPEVEEVPF